MCLGRASPEWILLISMQGMCRCDGGRGRRRIPAEKGDCEAIALDRQTQGGEEVEFLNGKLKRERWRSVEDKKGGRLKGGELMIMCRKDDVRGN